MNVIHVFNAINHSGAEIMYKAAAPLFIKKGFHLFALSTGKDKGGFSEEFEKAGYTIFHLPRLKEYKISYYLSFPKHFFSFYKLLKVHQIDVVHIHKRHLFWMYAIVGKIAGSRTIVRTVHNVFIPIFYRFPGYLIARHFTKLLGVKITSISESVYENELSRFWNHTAKIYNWFDPNNFYPAKSNNERDLLREALNLNPDCIVLITVGSCLRVKNHAIVIKALRELINRLDKQIVYLHVGDGPLNKQEKELAEQENVVDNVRFWGNTSNVRELLLASDIFIMPSLIEGLGISAIEAMACKIPCVLFDSPGLRDLIPNNSNNGLLVNHSLDDLINAILFLINNPKEKVEYALNAERFVKKKFSMQKQVAEICKLYNE